MFISTTEPPISFLKPEKLLRAENDYASRRISIEELRQIRKETISDLVAKQKSAGLNILTDGSFTRANGLRDFWLQFNGVTPHVVISGHLFQDQNAGEVIPKVTDRIRFNPAHESLNDFAFLQNEAGAEGVVRSDIPAPSLFYIDLIRNDWYDRSVYPTSQALAADISKAYNETIKALYNSGCRRLLMIDYSWGRLCDNIGSKRLVQGGIDLTTLPDILRNINEEALIGIPADMHIILYTPFDAALTKEYASIMECICSHRRVDTIMIDLPDSPNCFRDMLSRAPKEKEWILGIENALQPQLMTHDEISGYLSDISQVIPKANIRLTTKGGFRRNSDTIDCSSFDEHDQWNKIENLMHFSSQTIAE